MKWMLCCYAGMTTSILGKKLEEEAAGRGFGLTVKVLPIAEAEAFVDEVEAIILGPHVRFMEENLKKAAPETPVYVIRPQDFGTMNTKVIVDEVLALGNGA